MNKHYLTSDTHFYHENVKKYCGRPEGFESKISLGLSLIKEEDILIHLGDICMGKDVEVHKTFIEPLKCKKWLIRGNHDKKSDTWYMKHGWDFVSDGIILNKFGMKILLTHEPSLGDDFDINVHGHQHNSVPDPDKVGYIKHKLYALEYVGYQPVSLRKFVGQ